MKTKPKITQKEKDMVKALAFYAQPDTYFAIGFFPDPPCGDFIKDFDKTKKPGARARKVLKKHYPEVFKILTDPNLIVTL